MSAGLTAPSAPEAGLHVVGTPIGNLGDITLRALEVLRGVDEILAEDTRHTGILLRHHGIGTRMRSCHQFNEAAIRDRVVARIRDGAALALVTDAGTPGLSDPGSRVVTACRAAGLGVWTVPGPSALAAAVSVSGWDLHGFVFRGFLPHGPGRRRRLLAEALDAGLPVVLYESPHRLLRLLDDIRALAPGALVFVGRELTKKFEESGTEPVETWIKRFDERKPRGEFVVMVRPDGGGAPEGKVRTVDTPHRGV